MRSIKELLELMLQHKDFFAHGLCHWITTMKRMGVISGPEYWLLEGYIVANRPSKWSSLGALINQNSTFYWPRRDIKPRIRWIKHHIKRNS